MKKNNEILEFVLHTFIICILSFICFIILLHTPLFNNIKVYMYRGIVLLIISFIANILLSILLKNTFFKSITIKDIISISLVYISVVMMFFTLVPVTVERSVTVHMLFSMDKYEKMSKEDIQNNFIKNYIIENDAFQKRIIEQDVTGSIELDTKDNTYHLTKKGKTLVYLFKLIGQIFNADMNLMPQS